MFSARGITSPASMREIVPCDTPSRRAISSWLIPRLLNRADASTSRCLRFGGRGGLVFFLAISEPHNKCMKCIDLARTKMRIPHGEACEAVEVSDMLREPPELATTEY